MNWSPFHLVFPLSFRVFEREGGSLGGVGFSPLNYLNPLVEVAIFRKRNVFSDVFEFCFIYSLDCDSGWMEDYEHPSSILMERISGCEIHLELRR